jgi:hypothetical protein
MMSLSHKSIMRLLLNNQMPISTLFTTLAVGVRCRLSAHPSLVFV